MSRNVEVVDNINITKLLIQTSEIDNFSSQAHCYTSNIQRLTQASKLNTAKTWDVSAWEPSSVTKWQRRLSSRNVSSSNVFATINFAHLCQPLQKDTSCLQLLIYSSCHVLCTLYKCLTLDEIVCEDLLFWNRALISVYPISSAISAAVCPFCVRYTHTHID